MNKRLRLAVLQRDRFRCVYCGRGSDTVELHVDHVVPRAAGGSDESTNLVTACADCNMGKLDAPIALPDYVSPVAIPKRQRTYRRAVKSPPGEWLEEAKRRYPDDTDLAWVDGTGRFAVIAWCSVLSVALFSDTDAAMKALQQINATGCGHGCWGDHQTVDLAVPEILYERVEKDRGWRRIEHFNGCPTCRYLSSGQGQHAAEERMSMRCIKAGKQDRMRLRSLGEFADRLGAGALG